MAVFIHVLVDKVSEGIYLASISLQRLERNLHCVLERHLNLYSQQSHCLEIHLTWVPQSGNCMSAHFDKRTLKSIIEQLRNNAGLTEHVCRFSVTSSGQWAPRCFRASSSSWRREWEWKKEWWRRCEVKHLIKNQRHQPCAASGGIKEANLSASFEEKAFESRAGPHQRLDAILGDLITPGDVELLQQGATLTEKMGVEKQKPSARSWCDHKRGTRDPTYLSALRDRFVIEVQEVRSKCFNFGQNLLRLLHVLQKRKPREFKVCAGLFDISRTIVQIPVGNLCAAI